MCEKGDEMKKERKKATNKNLRNIRHIFRRVRNLKYIKLTKKDTVCREGP